MYIIHVHVSHPHSVTSPRVDGKSYIHHYPCNAQLSPTALGLGFLFNVIASNCSILRSHVYSSLLMSNLGMDDNSL